jgi:hypothetical protein
MARLHSQGGQGRMRYRERYDASRKCEERTHAFQKPKVKAIRKALLAFSALTPMLILESQCTANFTANGLFGDTSLAARRYLG